MTKDISNQEILDAINSFSEETDKQFTNIKSSMVTKDYLDEKMADMRGDLVVLMRKEDTKLNKLTEILKDKKIITKKEQEAILSMEPFPKLSL